MARHTALDVNCRNQTLQVLDTVLGGFNTRITTLCVGLFPPSARQVPVQDVLLGLVPRSGRLLISLC